MNVKVSVDGIALTVAILRSLNSERFTPSIVLSRTLGAQGVTSDLLRHQLGHMMNLGLLAKTGGTVDAAYRRTLLGEKYQEAAADVMVGAAH